MYGLIMNIEFFFRNITSIQHNYNNIGFINRLTALQIALPNLHYIRDNIFA